MSRAKRTSLETLRLEPPAPARPADPAPPALAVVPPPPPRKRAVKQQTVYLPEPVYEQLRRLAFDERVKMHSLLIEGLDRVFRDRGLVPIPDLLREQP